MQWKPKLHKKARMFRASRRERRLHKIAKSLSNAQIYRGDIMMTPEKKKNQIRQTFDVLRKKPMTTKMIQVVTGIPRENITRYISFLEKRQKVVTVKEEPCSITGHKAKYYSTDPAYFPKETQSELFQPKGWGV